jgi:hypothetical protein
MRDKEQESMKADVEFLDKQRDKLSGIERRVLAELRGSGGMGGGYEFLRFKRDFYNHLSPSDQENVKAFLIRIFKDASTWPSHMGEKLVTVCSDLQLEVLRSEMEKVVAKISHEPERRQLRSTMIVFDPFLPKPLRFMFTELVHRDKTESDYRQFRERYSQLDGEEQQHVRDVLIEMVGRPEEFVARRALLALAVVDPADARPIADRHFPDEASRRKMPEDLQKFLGESGG